METGPDGRRILVVGCGGAGKTTFARSLAEKLALPMIHLDRHYWRAGWGMPTLDDWRAEVAELSAGSEWIMDGNYANSYDIRMPRADTLIWLDYPRTTCLRRVILRTLKDYGRSRPDLPEGCPEHFDLAFLRYVWDFPVKSRPRIAEGIDRHGRHLRVAQLRHGREIAAYLDGAGRA